MVESFSSQPQENFPFLDSFLRLYGILLLACSGYLLQQSVWSAITPFDHMVLSIVWVVLAQLLCLYTLWKRPDSMLWREVAATMLLWTFIPALRSMGELVNLHEHVKLCWLLFSLPVAYCMRSVTASAATVIAASFILVNDTPGSSPLWMIPVVSAVVPLCWNVIAALCRGMQRGWQSLGAVWKEYGFMAPASGWIICFLLGLLSMWIVGTHIQYSQFAFSFAMAYYTAIYCFGILRRPGRTPLWCQPFMVTGWLILAFCLTYPAFSLVRWHEETTNHYGEFNSFLFYGTYLVAGAFLVLVWMKKRHRLFLPVVCVSYGLFYHFTPFFRDLSASLVALGILLGMSLHAIRQGERNNQPGLMTMGIAVLSTSSFHLFRYSSFSLEATGIAFLAVGAYFVFWRIRPVWLVAGTTRLARDK